MAGDQFVAKRADLTALEPVIAHEMTHMALAYLSLPKWLDEGIAVNLERRLTGLRDSLYTPGELHEKHLEFWNEERIQEFWSGTSFQRTDAGNLVSYELARIPVEQMGRDAWHAFAKFVCAARHADAGAQAAQEILDVDLGASACAMVGSAPSERWAPGRLALAPRDVAE